MIISELAPRSAAVVATATPRVVEPRKPSTNGRRAMEAPATLRYGGASLGLDDDD